MDAAKINVTVRVAKDPSGSGELLLCLNWMQPSGAGQVAFVPLEKVRAAIAHWESVQSRPALGGLRNVAWGEES